MIIKMQILDIDYFINGVKPVIRIFGRTEAGTSICAFYDKFYPYFYIKPLGDTKVCAEKLRAMREVIGVEEISMKTPLRYKDAAENLLKITLLNPQEVPKMREKLAAMKLYEEIFEADIMFKYRFMIDNKLLGVQWIEIEAEREQSTIKSKVSTYRINSIKPIEKIENAELKYLAFDIECLPSDPRKPIDPKHDPIIMIAMSFMPQFRNKESVVLVAKPMAADNVKGFSTEKEMLEEFLGMIDSFDPDVLTGYNINGFDFPYIIERLHQNKLHGNLGRGDKEIFSKTYATPAIYGSNQEHIVTGRIVFDPFQILKRDPWVKFTRYDLKTVAKQLLNEEKHAVEYGDMPALWNGDRQQLMKLIEYARKDSDLSLKLVIDKGMLDKFIELSKISGLLLQDVMGGQTRRIETMILHEFKKRGYVMPLAPSKAELIRRKKERDKQGLKGATVLEPKKGLHSEGCILVMDFRSLYPSIMRTYNVSPDTLTSSEENAHQSPSGAYFIDSSVQEGMLPNILGRILAARSSTKKQMKAAKGDKKKILNAKQLALKDIANSVHASTDIVVKDDSGNLHVYEIEEFFDELAKSLPIISLGDTEVIELSGWETLSVDGDRSCFKPLYAVSRHKHKGDLTRLKTPMSEVMVTDGHSVMVMEGRSGRLVKKGGKDVSEEDVIAQVCSVQLPENNEVVFNWLENRMKTLSAFNGLTDSATVGNCGLVPIPTDDAEMITDFYEEFTTAREEPHYYTLPAASIIPVSIQVTEELAELMGWFVAEGSSKKVPDFILNSNKRIRTAFMKGYYSGGNKKARRLKISKRLASQLSLMLKESDGIQHNSFDGLYHIVSGDLFGQRAKVSRCAASGYVYDLSVRGTEMFVTAQGTVLHNSFYGYTGYIRARLYTIDVANTITAYGRQNLEKTKKLIEEEFGLEVIYADTDSVFVKTNTANLDDAKDLGEKISKLATERLPGHLELEFEKIYRTFLILTKKRYAGWKFEFSDGKWSDEIEMRGIETVRRDWCPLVSETMTNVLNMTLKEGDVQKAISYVKEIVDKLKKNEIPAEKLTIVKGIAQSLESYKGILPHIELARKLAARNPHSPPKVGDRLGFVIIKGNQMLSKRAEDPAYVERHNIAIDSDYYIYSQLLPPIERILSSVGVEMSEVLGNGHQINLEDLISGKKRKLKHDIEINYSKKENEDQALLGWEGFVCTKCKKSYRRPPLQGSCECGGELLIGYRGSLGNKVFAK